MSVLVSYEEELTGICLDNCEPSPPGYARATIRIGQGELFQWRRNQIALMHLQRVPYDVVFQSLDADLVRCAEWGRVTPPIRSSVASHRERVMRLHALMLLVTMQAAAPQPESLLVQRGRAGSVEIGATAESIHREFRDRAKLVDLELEGHLAPALELKRFGAQLVPGLIAEIGPLGDRLVVTRIHVLDSGFRTKERISVGSTYAELRSAYRIDWVASGEGSFFARVEELAISFQLDTSGEVPLWDIRDPAKVPGGVRITGMLLTR